MHYFFLFSTLLLLTAKSFANPSMADFLNGKKAGPAKADIFQVSCQYSLEGCPDEVDYLKGDYQRHLDNLYSCTKSFYGCGQDEQKLIDAHEISQRGISARQFSEMMHKYDPRLEHKGYFIPLGLTNRELIAFAAATSLGFVIFSHDQEIMDFIQEHKSEKTNSVATVGNMFGSSAIPPVAIGSYFLGAVLDNGELKQIGLFTVSAGLATQAITEGFKKTFNRVRPNGGEGPYAFGEKGNNSFFSGHTAAAWSFATVISEVYKEDHQWVPYLAYGMAAVTAYARMHDQKHWMTDVLAGAIMGHLITKAVIRIHKMDDSAGGLMVYPSYDSESGTTAINIFYTPKRPKQQLNCNKLPSGSYKIQACIQEAFEKSK